MCSDGLWERIEPLLPRKPRRFRYPGRKPFDDRLALQGILFVLHTGIGWEHLPQELGFGCGMTAWRRLRAWQQAGVWERLHELLLAELHAADQLEWERAIADAQPHAGEKGGSKTGPSPVDRGRAGSKHHLLVDGGGIPLAWTLTGGNRNDVTQLLELLDRVPPVRGRVGRPRRRPKTLLADRGYDHDKYRRLRLAARHQTRDRPPPDRARLRARPPPLGRRAHLRLAPQPPPPARPHRPPRRHPRRLPRPRLLPHLLATTGDLIQLELLRDRIEMKGPVPDDERRRHLSSSWDGCRWPLRRVDRRRPVVGTGRAAVAEEAAALPLSGPKALARSGRADRCNPPQVASERSL